MAHKIKSLSSALATLVAGASPAAYAVHSVPAPTPSDTNSASASASSTKADEKADAAVAFKLTVEREGENHSVLLRRSEGVELIAAHGSHSSHSSHSSHRSGR